MFGVLALDLVAGYPSGDLVRDPATVTGARWWTGDAAMLNATAWGIAAALGTFVAHLRPDHRRGLLLFAVLSAALMVDDTLQTKELVARVEIPEEVVLAGYAVVALVTAWLLRPARTGAGGWCLLAAGGLIGLSVVADVLRGESAPSLVLLELAPLFVGTAVWACVPVLVHAAPSEGGPILDGNVSPPSPQEP
ncbi:hypothetical protein [Aquipuribacter nitratireducens]|uniref:DUF998 domain-containing protein n=1 Tax=Aquipuribacter nitratireducens TaxID=650104 RepID=A0ABW0GSV9_9MICO